MASETDVTEDTAIQDRSTLSIPDQSLAEWFTERAAEYSDLPALQYRENGEFVEMSYADVLEEARTIAGGLQDLGIDPGDRIALRAETRHEWALVEVAALLSGAILVPVYTTFSPADAAYVIEDASATVLVDEASDVEPAVADAVDDVFEITDLPSGTLDGTPGADRDPEGIGVLIYTSGTTGDPKGVKLTHRNIHAELAVLRDITPTLEPGKTGTCYLPLAALAQRMLVFMYWDQGHAPVFLSTDRLVEDLTETEPEIMMGVPRVWRRMYSGILEEAAGTSGLKRSLLQRGIEVAKEYGAGRERDAVSNAMGLKHRVMDWLVYSTLREKLGLSNVEYAVTGAASLDAEVLHFFWGMDVPLIEVYGATETTAVCVGNRIDDFRAGTVGKPVPDTDVRLDSDGEILVRGPMVMDGYWNLPAKTRAAFDDGWYRTGDIGEWNGEYLAVIDRKKFMAVLDTGRNIYPEPIEEALRKSAYVDEALVVADDRKFVGALLQPNFEQLRSYADEEGIEYDDDAVREAEGEIVAVPRDLVDHPDVRAILEREIEAANADLADYETVKEFTVLERSLSVDEGELTPTLKKRRGTIEDNFSEQIEDIYS